MHRVPCVQSVHHVLATRQPNLSEVVHGVEELVARELHRLQEAFVVDLRRVVLIPGRVELSDTRGQIGAVRVLRRLVAIPHTDAVVDPIDRLDEGFVNLQIDLVNDRVAFLQAQLGGHDLLAKVLVHEAGTRQLGDEAMPEDLGELLLVVVEALRIGVIDGADVNHNVQLGEHRGNTAAHDIRAFELLRALQEEATECFVAVKRAIMGADLNHLALLRSQITHTIHREPATSCFSRITE
mmetsp:Transcript_26285/g.44001  ORF Transcript_26285/g.44001 Transcript_26285/m.44001 type:complete len:239 (+) Transcript_26285:563-1279(+)